MNINIVNIDDLLTPEKQLQSIIDSAEYIINRLSSFYDTEEERLDIQRNITHMELTLAKEAVLAIISENQLLSMNDVISTAKARLNV